MCIFLFVSHLFSLDSSRISPFYLSVRLSQVALCLFEDQAFSAHCRQLLCSRWGHIHQCALVFVLTARKVSEGTAIPERVPPLCTGARSAAARLPCSGQSCSCTCLKQIHSPCVLLFSSTSFFWDEVSLKPSLVLDSGSSCHSLLGGVTVDHYHSLLPRPVFSVLLGLLPYGVVLP